MWIGLDLGKLTDFAAMAVVSRSLAVGADGLPIRTARGLQFHRFQVLALRRYQLGTPYTDIVTHVVGQLRRIALQPSPRLVVDATGVGNAVMEMFRSALRMDPDIEPHAITITGGRDWSRKGRYDWHVAKVELVGAMRAALESRRVKVARGVAHAEALKRELLDFRVKLTAAANETFAGSEGTHDDLVLALCLPIWLADQRWFEMSTDERLDPHEASAVAAERRAIQRADQHAIAREHIDQSKLKEAQLERRKEQDRIAQENLNDPRWWGDTDDSLVE